ncbi:MAG TPA: hypothetical protein VE967_20010, partial [Gemmatimonadaceae bacterium]|nr:hypothetical protein [Gemmatimonadaceae bacterium]
MRFASLALLLAAGSLAAQPGPRYSQIYTLQPREGVFAYARISPDGKKLVYASQISARIGAPRRWTETLVDLTTKSVMF